MFRFFFVQVLLYLRFSELINVVRRQQLSQCASRDADLLITRLMAYNGNGDADMRDMVMTSIERQLRNQRRLAQLLAESASVYTPGKVPPELAFDLEQVNARIRELERLYDYLAGQRQHERFHA